MTNEEIRKRFEFELELNLFVSNLCNYIFFEIKDVTLRILFGIFLKDLGYKSDYAEYEIEEKYPLGIGIEIDTKKYWIYNTEPFNEKKNHLPEYIKEYKI